MIARKAWQFILGVVLMSVLFAQFAETSPVPEEEVNEEEPEDDESARAKFNFGRGPKPPARPPTGIRPPPIRPMSPSPSQIRPGFPAGGRLPQMPPGGKLPVMPQGGRLPVMPQGGRLPVMPQGGRLPVMPQGGRLPVMPQGGKLPVMPPGGKLPIKPQAGRWPIIPQGGKLPVLKPGAQLPTAPSGPAAPNWKNTLANSLIEGGINTAFIVPQTALTSWAQGQFAPQAQPGQPAAAPTQQQAGTPGAATQPGMGMQTQAGIIGQDPTTGMYIYSDGMGNMMLVDPSQVEYPSGEQPAAPTNSATETQPAS